MFSLLEKSFLEAQRKIGNTYWDQVTWCLFNHEYDNKLNWIKFSY